MLHHKTKSSLSIACCLCLFVSSSFSVVLIHSNLKFSQSFLPQIWFLSICVSSGICGLVLANKKASKKSFELQEASNWWCEAVGLPSLAAQILLKNESSFLFAMLHVVWACSMVALRKYEDRIPVKSLDLTKVGTVTASLSALVISASCYRNGNLFGILGSVGLILSHVILTSQKRFDDFTSFDAFLITLSISNYFLAISLL